jgi:hypothetical protein
MFLRLLRGPNYSFDLIPQGYAWVYHLAPASQAFKSSPCCNQRDQRRLMTLTPLAPPTRA